MGLKIEYCAIDHGGILKGKEPLIGGNFCCKTDHVRIYPPTSLINQQLITKEIGKRCRRALTGSV